MGLAGPDGSQAAITPSTCDYPDLAAAVTIPGAEPGILAPYQERPQFHPLELRLRIDPAQDKGKLFPLLIAAGITHATATNTALAATLAQLDAQIPALYAAHAESYKNLLAHATSIETPDQTLNEAFQWAVLSIEQLKTKTIPGQSYPPAHDAAAPATDSVQREKGVGDPETALVAGYFTSADSARPGFGWFFGRDALYTLYAVNGYGDFALSKAELEFLIHRQRADGKIMHEYSQTAAAIDWQAFPYMYAAADSTPLFLLAIADYVRSSRRYRLPNRPPRCRRESLGLRDRSRPRHRSRRHLRQLARAPAGSRAGPAACPIRRSTSPSSISKPPPPWPSSNASSMTRANPAPRNNEPTPLPRPSNRVLRFTEIVLRLQP